MLERVIAAYSQALLDTDRERALAVAHQALDQGISPEDVVFKVVLPAIENMMDSVSRGFDADLAQHFLASQIAADVTEAMVARFTSVPEVLGRVVIGTSPGDFHGLGKRIVTACLRAQMRVVTDLGR